MRFLGAWLAGGCGGPEPTLGITLVPPLSAQVGREISVPLLATRGDVPVDDDALAWAWQPLSRPELERRLRRPTLTAYTHGRAVWRWTPLAEDAGAQRVAFTVTLDTARGGGELALRVEPGGAPPVFREPVGEGTTLDLRTSSCAEVAVVVESTAEPSAVLRLLDPPAGAHVTQSSALTGTLSFCPTPAQIGADTVYPLTLQAESGGQVVRKSYVIVLRRA